MGSLELVTWGGCENICYELFVRVDILCESVEAWLAVCLGMERRRFVCMEMLWFANVCYCGWMMIWG